MNTFHLTVARVGENLFNGEALSVSLPGSEGMLEILAHHKAFVAPLKKGVLSITAPDGAKTQHEVQGGIVEVSHNQATVLL
jgi:F-type H+-transporting ATPase subunit epsilon